MGGADRHEFQSGDVDVFLVLLAAAAGGDRRGDVSTDPPSLVIGMAALRSKRTIFVVLAAVVVITLVGMYVRRQLAIDACLDHGGRWDHAANRCNE
jgi:hypothetical protein